MHFPKPKDKQFLPVKYFVMLCIGKISILYNRKALLKKLKFRKPPLLVPYLENLLVYCINYALIPFLVRHFLLHIWDSVLICFKLSRLLHCIMTNKSQFWLSLNIKLNIFTTSTWPWSIKIPMTFAPPPPSILWNLLFFLIEW